MPYDLSLKGSWVSFHKEAKAALGLQLMRCSALHSFCQTLDSFLSMHCPSIILCNEACQTTPKCLLQWPQHILWVTLSNVDNLFSCYYFTFPIFHLGQRVGFDGRCAILCPVLFDFLLN